MGKIIFPIKQVVSACILLTIAQVTEASFIISNWSKTATTLDFDLQGTFTISDNVGSDSQNRLHFGIPGAQLGASDIVSSDIVGTIVDNGGSTPTNPSAYIFDQDAGAANDSLQVLRIGPYVIGDVINYSVSFTGLSNGLSITDNPIISWGYDVYGNNPEIAYKVGELESGSIPEPATLALMGLGLVSIGYRRYKKAA